MMVRETSRPESFRNRAVRRGSQVVISPWHLHRQARLWDNPDGFDPARWETDNGKACMREAFIPFSAGARVCTGAGFAMVEGVLVLAMLCRAFRFERITGDDPVPVAHLTVRARDGIRVRVSRR
jgi:cytochrome P450